MKTRSAWLPSLLLALVLTACGTGGGGDGSASSQGSAGAGTGTVGILFTDATTDDFDAIKITIHRIELLAVDGERVEVFFSAAGETVDLLQLANVSQLISLADVPAKFYEKIRLTLSKLELIRDGQVIAAPKLPGNGKLDLNPRMTFFVEPASTLLLEIDIDAKKSIHIVRQGNGGYHFRPVVFVKLLRAGQLGKLVRVHGVIKEIERDDDGGREFELCPQRFMLAQHHEDDHEDDRERCAEVKVTNDTSIFDENADPVDFSALAVGAEVTVFGRFQKDDDEDKHHQSSSSDDVDDDHGERDRHHDLHLNAFVIEIGPLGTFTSLDGEVVTSPTPVNAVTAFDFTVDPAQNGIPAGTRLSAQLQAQTKVFSKSGVELDSSAIQPGRFGTVNGILLLSNTVPDAIKLTLVVLDLLPDQVVKLSGIIGQINPENRQFELETATDTKECVVAPVGTQIVRVVSSSSGLSSELVGFDALETGQEADVFGATYEAGCLVARLIVIFVVQP